MSADGGLSPNRLTQSKGRDFLIHRRLTDDFHARPFRLRHRWVSTKQIIESETSPPGDRTPSFNANQPCNLILHREPSHQIPNIERDAQARVEPVYGEIPSGNISRIRSSSVVVVVQRSNLRFGVCGHPTISRVERFCYIVVDTQCSVQKPLLRGRVDRSTHTHATQRILWQEKPAPCQRCQCASPKEQKVAPGSITQDPGRDLIYRKRSLFKET